MSQLNRIAARLAGAGGQQSSVTPSPIPQQPVGSSSAVERDGATLLVVNRLANATFPDVGEFVPPESPPTLDGVSFDKVQPINPFPPKPINPFTGNSPEQNAGCYTSVGGQCPKPPSDPTTPPSPPAPIRFNGMSAVAPEGTRLFADLLVYPGQNLDLVLRPNEEGEFVWSGGQGIQTEHVNASSGSVAANPDFVTSFAAFDDEVPELAVVSLADGFIDGFLKTVSLARAVDGASWRVQPESFADGAFVSFTAAGGSAQFVWNKFATDEGGEWELVNTFGGTLH